MTRILLAVLIVTMVGCGNPDAAKYHVSDKYLKENCMKVDGEYYCHRTESK